VSSRGLDQRALEERPPDAGGFSCGALDIALDPAQIAAIEAAVPKDAAAGERYPARAMVDLDSERVPATRT